MLLHANVVREAAKAVAAEMMELEASELIGAGRGERRPEDRATQRDGYPLTALGHARGEINPEIPKLRQGSYFSSGLESRRRSAQARDRLSEAVAHLDGRLGRIATMLEDAEADVLAFYGFPSSHWRKLRSTNSARALQPGSRPAAPTSSESSPTTAR